MRNALILSVLDQAVLSAFNFVLALILIRYWADAPEMFGIYAVILAGSLTLISVQNALCISHLTVLRPKARDAAEERALLSMFWSANVLLLAAAMGVTFVGSFLALGGGDLTLALSAALYTGGALLREYTRCYHFSGLKVASVLMVDCISLGLSAAAIAAVWLFWPPLDLDTLFLILAAAQGFSSVPAIVACREHFRLSFSKTATDAYRIVWHEQSKWALMSVIATEFQQRGYVFVVAAVFGPAQVALLQAAALLFRPVQLLVHAWGKLARVILAGHFAAGRYGEARAFTLQSLGALGLVLFGFLVLLWLAWPPIRTHMFHGQFADLEMTVVLWSAATAVIMVQGIFSVEAQSLIKFRELCYGAILGALVCAATLVPVVLIGDPRGAILAVVSGQLMMLYWIYRILAGLVAAPAGKGAVAPEGGRL